MLREDYFRFLEVVEKELNEKYVVQNCFSDSFYDKYHIPLKIRHKNSLLVEREFEDDRQFQGVFIDIFPMDYIQEKGESKLDIYHKSKKNGISFYGLNQEYIGNQKRLISINI